MYVGKKHHGWCFLHTEEINAGEQAYLCIYLVVPSVFWPSHPFNAYFYTWKPSCPTPSAPRLTTHFYPTHSPTHTYSSYIHLTRVCLPHLVRHRRA